MMVKIGMVAPSKAGKTSLMMAIFQAMKDGLSGNKQGIQYYGADNVTVQRIRRALAEFVTVNSTDGFAIPRIKGSESSVHYKFGVSVNVKTGKETVGFDFLDYPGGLLGTTQFAPIQSFLDDSDVMLVPIPSDILMTWKMTRGISDMEAGAKNIAAQCTLYDNDVRKCVVDWAKRRAAQGRRSLLVFAPLKCEAYFDDNNGSVDHSQQLHEAVEELYASQLDLSDNVRRNLQIETFAVDTYGIVELRDVQLKEDEGGVQYLVSNFVRRANFAGRPITANDISIKGALEIFATIVDFHFKCIAKNLGMEQSDLERSISEYGILKKLWHTFFKDPQKQRLADVIQENQVVYDALIAIKNLMAVSEKRHRVNNKIEW